MSSQELNAFYSKREEAFSKELAETTSQINMISNARLAIALFFLFLLYYGLQHDFGFLIVLPVLAGSFFYLVLKHSKLFNAKIHLQNLVKINEEEMTAVHGDPSSPDTGAEFIAPHHPYSHDLDIFGSGSLYHWLNRANTLIGRKKFADRLSYPLPSADLIVGNQ